MWLVYDLSTIDIAPQHSKGKHHHAMARTLIGRKIRERRRALGLTQAALARQLDISASYLNLIEADRRNIAGALLLRVAGALGVSVDEMDGAAERRLVSDLGEIATDAAVATLQLAPASAADLAARYPDWAQALVSLHRANLAHQQTVTALSDRLSQDPFLGDAVHSLLANLTAIRSASEILESVGELEPAQRQRFVSIIAGDSRRLTDVAQSLADFFSKAHTATRSVTPVDDVDDFLAENDNHFPPLEVAADALRAELDGRGGSLESTLAAWLRHAGAATVAAPDAPPASGRFELARAVAAIACRDAVAAQLDSSTRLHSAPARRRAERALLSYVAGCVLMPYDSFGPAAAEARYDIDALARHFGTSFEQVCHRLVTLRRPGAEGLRLGFMRADAAGYVSKRLALPRLPLPRYGHACPLWAVYQALQAPGATVRQLAEFPGGGRYLMVARAVEKDTGAFHAPRRLLSITLMCDALQADGVIYGDGLDLSHSAPATPVGLTCRTCVRRDCRWRQEDPIIDAGMY